MFRYAGGVVVRAMALQSQGLKVVNSNPVADTKTCLMYKQIDWG